jgi:hypothetical protein
LVRIVWVFDSDSTYIGPITNVRAGGERGATQHNVHTDHVTIRSELTYLLVAKIVDLKCRVFRWKPVEMVCFRVGTRPPTEPGIWTSW